MKAHATYRVEWLRLVLLGGACALAACATRTHSSTSPDVSETGGATGTGSGATGKAETGQTRDGEQDDADAGLTPYVDIYDPNTIPSFELTFDDAAMAVLTNPAVETEKDWVHAKFKFGAITLDDVGVRRKGTSTFRALPEKASLKVKFNKWVKGQKVHRLKEITLNNMMSDPTFLAERLSYHVFRSMGLPAPRANTAQLKINGEDYGIFANIETIDEDFLNRAFGKNTMVSLYEVNWGSSWLPNGGARTGFAIDVALPNAPPGAMPDAERLFRAVEAAADVTLLRDIDCCLHTSTGWLRHSAAEAVTGHYDGYAFGIWGSHNYFMAGDTAGKFALVPWSVDLTLSDRAGVVDASAPKNSTVLTRCKLSGACWAAYKTEVAAALTTYQSLNLVDQAHAWRDQIAALATADPRRPVRIDDRQIETLYAWLAARPAVVRAQLGL